MYVHKPVLLNECLRFLSPMGEVFEKNAFMVDGTLGEGGHSYAFLNAYESLKIIGVDADEHIQKRAKERLAVFGGRMSFFCGWFDDFFANYPEKLQKPNLILLDLGISVFHYEAAKRGFSFRDDESLDMRLNAGSELSAADIIHTYKENDLADLIYNFAEERYSRRIARAIVQARSVSRIINAKTLADIIERSVPANYKYARIHPATKTFQALRIAVNDEFGRLDRVLKNAFSVLEPNGKFGIITFHSLEDKRVKQFFKMAAKDCICPPEQAKCVCGGKRRAQILTRKAVEASEEEIRENPPSRSARLRVIQKV